MVGLQRMDNWWRMLAFGAPPAQSYAENLDRQCGIVLVPSAVLCLTAWLPYLWLDRSVHPERTELPVLRLSLSAVALLVLTLGRLPGRPMRPAAAATLLLGWLQVAGAAITGLSGGDTVYVGGFILLILVGPAIPLPRRVSWGLLALAYATLVATGALTGLSLTTPRSRYSLNDVVTAGLVSAFLVYVADAVRREAWQQARRIAAYAAEQQRDAARIGELERVLLEPTLPLTGGQPPTGARVTWQLMHVVVPDPAGQVELARGLPAHALVAESLAWTAALDAVALDHGLVPAVGLDGARLFVASDSAGANDAIQGAASTMLAASAALDLGLVARGQPAWRLRLGAAVGRIAVANIGGEQVAYDVWGDTVTRAQACAARSAAGTLGQALPPAPSVAADATVSALRSKLLIRGLAPMP
ncbi:MAG: hypothetical protein EXR77_20410 [Myxococcales bacterium]|nr:hypothetical protein [Myxococcales bacterium]